MSKNILLYSFVVVAPFVAFAQTSAPVYYKGAVKEKKMTLRRNIIQNTITANLSLPLNAATEENWMAAFWGMQLIRYKSPWADARVQLAFDSIGERSTGFQRSLLELAYTNYPREFVKQVRSLQAITNHAKVFAMCSEYLLLTDKNPIAGINLQTRKQQLIKTIQDDAIIGQLSQRVAFSDRPQKRVPVSVITSPDFLKDQVVMFSFQRKNRDFPGLAMIRDSSGQFVKDEHGVVFTVPQLARSISNLPGYLTNGNTPQGIFRMYGFDTSKTTFIGPTTNIQLTMPFETSLQHFFNDSTIIDTLWTPGWYAKLLPGLLKNYGPLYESFYAGQAGRTEIIAHGTTVDPEYYSGTSYYPQTPTMGCLCTIEAWSEADGKRLVSDQERLVNAVRKAGGPNGYCLVIEIDDQQSAITASEILPLLKQGSIQ